jgi:hypothetical protein
VETPECKKTTTSSALQTRRRNMEQGTEEHDLRPGTRPFICRPL